MKCGDKFDENILRCHNIFDIAAICYNGIRKRVRRNREPYFMAVYFDYQKENEVIKNVDEVENPNLEKLKELVNNIYLLFRDNPQECYYCDNLQEICRLINEIELEPFLEKTYEIPEVLFAVLLGIDTYIGGERKEGRFRMPRKGPLNHPESCEDTAVYMSDISSFMKKEEQKIKYRKKTSVSDISNELNNLSFLDNNCWFPDLSYPTTVPIELDKRYRKGINKTINKKIIKIAVFPYTNKREFEFVNRVGSAFGVDYDNTQINRQITDLQTMVNFAVDHNANFVIFPEFTMSPALLKGLKEYLLDVKRQDYFYSSGLIAILAGSTWEESDNNVLHILDYTGIELGTYFKYSPFVQEDIRNDNIYEMCEGLKDPGKRCCMLDIEEIGRVLPAICRDVINGEYTEKLIKIFSPCFVLAPAYSASVSSFEPHFDRYGKEFHVCSVLCNCCDSVGEKYNQVGIVCYPQKKDSRMQVTEKKIARNSVCQKSCQKSTCCQMVTFDFSSLDEAEKQYCASVDYFEIDKI